MASDLRPDLLPPAVSAYIAERAAQPDEALTDLRARTAELGRAAGMQVSADEGALLTLLTRVVGARRAVEVGTFTGYSSICIARGLADGGHLLCCDVDEKVTAIARAAWAQAGVEDRIELRIAPALETLQALPPDSTIDLAFIDADKGGYVDYYEELLPRLRPGGVILADNTLWSGRVADEPSDDEHDNTAAIRRFNDHVAADQRVDSYILPVSDGLTVIRKR
jgi:caffeoyl-CoA O-methyltransferase